jgi:hypothetical protein
VRIIIDRFVNYNFTKLAELVRAEYSKDDIEVVELGQGHWCTLRQDFVVTIKYQVEFLNLPDNVDEQILRNLINQSIITEEELAQLEQDK